MDGNCQRVLKAAIVQTLFLYKRGLILSPLVPKTLGAEGHETSYENRYIYASMLSSATFIQQEFIEISIADVVKVRRAVIATEKRYQIRSNIVIPRTECCNYKSRYVFE